MTAVPALVYETEAAAVADVAIIDTFLGLPKPGADTWALPVPRWDGKYWFIDPINEGHDVPGLSGEKDPDANAWPEVP